MRCSSAKCIGVVEAKRRNKNVSAHVDQAQRYARGFRFEGGAEAIGEPWPDIGNDRFFVPFVFSTNGRPYLKQVETESGIWFRDARKPSNHRRALSDWPTPDGLKGMLEIDAEAAQADLKARPFDFGFPLRPYQKHPIEVVEAGLAQERRNMLLAMATGTGKTKLAIAMLYRLLAAKRFRPGGLHSGPQCPRDAGRRGVFNNAHREREDLCGHLRFEGA